MERALQESGKRLQFLSSHLLTAQERERRRVSVELHDELGQALTVLKLQLRSIERKLRKDQAALREDCEDTLRYVDQIIDNVRRLSRDLSPSILEDLGLSAALRWVIDDVSRHYGFEASVKMEDIKHLFSEEAQIIIYRVFQEALANAGKHAHATNISIAIEKRDGSVFFVLEDNGNGFDVEYVRAQASTEKGLGLAAMDERLRMLGGSLDIWSEEGTGTKITFTVPVEEGGSL
jgi:signal transduction histidine kinase